MNSLSVSVSILDCILLRFLLETDTEIDREFLSNYQNVTLGRDVNEMDIFSDLACYLI